MTLTGDIGSGGEVAARHFLEQRGYTYLDANWNCKAGEIDLIMKEGAVRVLVEVRTRRPTLYGAGLDTVGIQKQQKLIRAAKWYQQQENYWGPMRFDVVSIVMDPQTKAVLECEHIEHAFEV